MHGIPSTPPARRSAAEERTDQPIPVHLLKQSLQSCRQPVTSSIHDTTGLTYARRTLRTLRLLAMPGAADIGSALSNAGLWVFRCGSHRR